MLRLKLNNCLPSKMIAVTEHCRIALQKTSLHQWYWGRWLLRSISTRYDCCWFTWLEFVDNVNLRSSCDNSKVAMSWMTLQPICFSLCWNLQSMGTFSTMFDVLKIIFVKWKTLDKIELHCLPWVVYCNLVRFVFSFINF